MKKKLFAVLMAFAMIFSLAACSASSSEAPATSGSTANDSSAAASEDSVEITVWGWDASFNGTVLAEADKLDDSVTVNFVEMDKLSCLEKIHVALSSGVTDDLPDIVLISDLNAQAYLMSYPGAFYSLDGILNYDDFADYKKDYVTYDGVGYGVPFDTGVAGLFYRLDYIEEAGYTEEDMQNLTWEEYLALGEALKANGHMLQTYNPNDIAEFQIMLQSCGKWFTNENGEADFTNNAALKECYDIFKQLNESDFVKVVSDWNEFTAAINGGDVACVLRGCWITSTIKAADDQSGLWRVAPVPLMNQENATQYSNQGGSSFFVLANGPHPEEAAQFLANTLGGSTELYDTVAKSINFMGTYLPAATVDAYTITDEFFGGQNVNGTLAGWLDKIPQVKSGDYSAEAQSALLAVTPQILSGADLDTCLADAEQQYAQLTMG